LLPVILLFVCQSGLVFATARVLLRMSAAAKAIDATGKSLFLLSAGGAVLLMLSARGIFAASLLLLSETPPSVGYAEWLLAVTGAITLAIFGAYGRLLVERHQLCRAVEQMAATDALTGAYTRNTFFTTASPLVHAARRYRHPLTALVIDIDQMRRIQDEFGSAAGDQSLKLLGGTLGNCVRNIDVLGRVEAEKFAIVLPHTDLDGANVVADRIRNAIQREFDQIYSETSVRLTANVGVAALHDGNLENLLNVAEGSIYSPRPQPPEPDLSSIPVVP